MTLLVLMGGVEQIRRIYTSVAFKELIIWGKWKTLQCGNQSKETEVRKPKHRNEKKSQLLVFNATLTHDFLCEALQPKHDSTLQCETWILDSRTAYDTSNSVPSSSYANSTVHPVLMDRLTQHGMPQNVPGIKHANPTVHPILKVQQDGMVQHGTSHNVTGS